MPEVADGREARNRKPPRTGIKDVAAHAGVSVGTVSHVLNHPERVRPMVRERVEESIEKLGYLPNDAARQLRIGTLPNNSHTGQQALDQCSHEKEETDT